MAILLAGGCVPSLHSIVTEKTLVYDPAFVGKFQVEDAVWTVAADPNEKSYGIQIQEKEGKQSLLVGRIAEFQGRRFLDLYPSNDEKLNTGDWFNAHILPVHTFWQLEKADGHYTLKPLNPDTVKAVLKDKPQLVKHELVDEDDRVVLTDTAAKLQDFLIAGLSIEKFYGEAFELKPLKD